MVACHHSNLDGGLWFDNVITIRAIELIVMFLKLQRNYLENKTNY